MGTGGTQLLELNSVAPFYRDFYVALSRTGYFDVCGHWL
jgi:hypothetical protein